MVRAWGGRACDGEGMGGSGHRGQDGAGRAGREWSGRAVPVSSTPCGALHSARLSGSRSPSPGLTCGVNSVLLHPAGQGWLQAQLSKHSAQPKGSSSPANGSALRAPLHLGPFVAGPSAAVGCDSSVAGAPAPASGIPSIPAGNPLQLLSCDPQTRRPPGWRAGYLPGPLLVGC